MRKRISKKEIIRRGKAIAEFHGKYNTNWHTISAYPEEKLQYHSSWDWIMPVVEKIENLKDGKYMFEICCKHAEISIMYNHNWPEDKKTLHEYYGLSSKLKAVFMTVSDFCLEWQQEKKTNLAKT